MSEPQIIKRLDPHEIEALIKTQKEIEAAKEKVRLDAQPVIEYDPTPGPEAIPTVTKQLEPHEVGALIKAREEVEAARETARLAALPIEEYDLTPGPEAIPRVTKQLEPHEMEALFKAQKEAEATREAARLAAQPVIEYDPIPGPEGIPTVTDEKGREISYLEMYPACPEPKYPQEEPLSFQMGDPRAAVQSPHRMIVPKGDAELPPGYPGRLT